MVAPEPLTEGPTWHDSRLEKCAFTLRGYQSGELTTCGRQEHGSRVHIVDGSQAPSVGDGLWTTAPGLVVAVRVADCVPILLWDPGVAAVAAVHAGAVPPVVEVELRRRHTNSRSLTYTMDETRLLLTTNTEKCIYKYFG